MFAAVRRPVADQPLRGGKQGIRSSRGISTSSLPGNRTREGSTDAVRTGRTLPGKPNHPDTAGGASDFASPATGPDPETRATLPLAHAQGATDLTVSATGNPQEADFGVKVSRATRSAVCRNRTRPTHHRRPTAHSKKAVNRRLPNTNARAVWASPDCYHHDWRPRSCDPFMQRSIDPARSSPLAIDHADTNA